MIGASKILTVSYGTFSCTLEGFDEPFNTMKAIAEYFRDLAADDRYFGAEPPTPDAAMLHKIAEREVQRRVEAKIGENGVHLTAQEPAATQLSAPVVDIVSEPAALPTLNAMPEGVAARLAKIRASVAQGDAVVIPAAVVAVPEFTEDQHADEMLGSIADFAAFDDADIAPFDTPPAMTTPDVPEIDIPVLDEIDEDDDVLADLAALDMPVNADVAPDAAAIFLPDDVNLPDDSNAFTPVTDLPALEEDPGFDMADLDLGIDAPPEAPLAPETPDDADLVSRLGALIDPEDSDTADAPDVVSDWTDFETLDAALDAADDADTTEMPAFDVAADIDTATDEIDIPPVAETEELAVAQPDLPPTQDDAEVAPDMADKIQRARARVIRIRRNPNVIAAPVVAANPEPTLSADPAPAAALSDEAEAELARELAALEFETPTITDDQPTLPDDDAELRRQLAMIEDDVAAAPVTAPAEPVEGTAAHTAMADAVQDAAVSRLMQQTQSEMAVPENRRRLSAIAHLKAAVAATVAERFGTKAKIEEVEATRAEPYRDDLARVVRPRRPEGSGVAPVRPAPLVLVSEQRIDRPVVTAPATVTPVRPRRVSSAALAPQLDDLIDEDDDLDDDENIFSDTRGFAEFADRLGAHSLPDMLEAAAAYAATVEGRPSFSRPQLMRQVSIATGEADVSREDSLRSFGALLRDGRIVKVRRGQFALTAQSRFLADAKKIAD